MASRGQYQTSQMCLAPLGENEKRYYNRKRECLLSVCHALSRSINLWPLEERTPSALKSYMRWISPFCRQGDWGTERVQSSGYRARKWGSQDLNPVRFQSYNIRKVPHPTACFRISSKSSLLLTQSNLLLTWLITECKILPVQQWHPRPRLATTRAVTPTLLRRCG